MVQCKKSCKTLPISFISRGHSLSQDPIKILITGGDGQSGQAIARLAQSDPFFQVTALPRKQLDITQPHQIMAQLDRYLPDYVINAAGFNSADRAEREPEKALQINAEGVRNLALACGELSIPVIHLSTDYVFDGHYASGYSEEDPVAPLGVYGQTRLQGELYLQQLLPQHIILRCSWIFSERGDNFMLRLLNEAREQSVLQAVDDRRGCPTSAHDLARVVLAILKQLSCGAEPWGIFHYCGAEVTTRYGFSEALIAAARQYEDLKVAKIQPVGSADLPYEALRPATSVLKCKKILNVFGIRQRPWRSELQRLIREYYGQIRL
ncbi:dTDP-4-dehydrorhamnose reductase [Nitrincola tapanii]|uniref:dTDP-4-dehydrorhamnose reductase n=1 Tax=Nitrincola tapanii TaxID=1708751 RepID=A0A5A9W8T6_9GAMM|nr:dTDP-4-dehydrorhamnose reductase [Nitrincola tapanii]